MSAVGVLFDLDGTLVDTAPDLVAVLNELLHERGRVRMPFAIARNEVSNGAIGLLRLGFGELAGTRLSSTACAPGSSRSTVGMCVSDPGFSLT